METTLNSPSTLQIHIPLPWKMFAAHLWISYKFERNFVRLTRTVWGEKLSRCSVQYNIRKWIHVHAVGRLRLQSILKNALHSVQKQIYVFFQSPVFSLPKSSRSTLTLSLPTVLFIFHIRLVPFFYNDIL